MSATVFDLLPGLAGPRPTLPMGGRIGDVSRRRDALQSDADSATFDCCLRRPRVGRGPTAVARSAVPLGFCLRGGECVERIVPKAGFAAGPGGGLT